jgi:hypothetical protein
MGDAGRGAAMLILGALFASLFEQSLRANGPTGAEAFIRSNLRLKQYESASIDLNRDGAPEVIVYDDAPERCGSGGCGLIILTSAGRSYRVVTRVSITRPPIRVLSTSSHGWRDLGVKVVGGGIMRAYEARLRFDGRSYPSNPTMPPAVAVTKARGRTLIR